MPFPRYTTYRDDELVAALKQLAPPGQPIPEADTLRRQGNGSAATTRTEGESRPAIPARGSLLKEHYCVVAYPDGATGSCRYVRVCPDWHQFQYRHLGRDHTSVKDTSAAEQFLVGAPLPTQRFGARMGNSPEAIEEKAKELAASAFAEAIRREQKERFQRASAPLTFTGKKTKTGNPQFSAKRAREIGGKYALCRQLGMNLVPDSALFATLSEANTAWKEREDTALHVACACRWSRRWEVPQFNTLNEFNPLHAQKD